MSQGGKKHGDGEVSPLFRHPVLPKAVHFVIASRTLQVLVPGTGERFAAVFEVGQTPGLTSVEILAPFPTGPSPLAQLGP